MPTRRRHRPADVSPLRVRNRRGIRVGEKDERVLDDLGRDPIGNADAVKPQVVGVGRAPTPSTVLRQRQSMYLANHYSTLHVTVVGLTLGVAAVVASNLLAGVTTPRFDSYQPVFYILWLASLLAIAVAYGGPMIANILMPDRIPAIADLLLPLLIAVCEFTLFTILGYRLTGWTSPRAVLAAWWLTLGAFCLVAFMQTRRAHYLILEANTLDPVGGIIPNYVKRLKSNFRGALLVAFMGTCVGVYYLTSSRLQSGANYVFAGLVVVALAIALDVHRRTAVELRAGFKRLAEE